MTIFKFFVLLALNLIVVMAIRQQQKSNIGRMRAHQEADSSRSYRNSNLILLGSLTLYLVTQTPAVTFNCLKIASDTYKSFNFPYSVRLFANPFIVMSFLTNYSVNFILYVTVSRRFRSQLTLLFADCFFWKTVPPGKEKRSGLDGSIEPQEIALSFIPYKNGHIF